MNNEQYMAKAIGLARNAWYSTRPNPRVGCVVVKNDTVIASGYHQKAGKPHAEIHALTMAGQAAQGASAYITLEPCVHQGRTPPCVDALIEAGIAKVVVAGIDPNPMVCGRGVKRLRKAGIEVIEGVLEEDAKALNVGFNKRMQTGLPRVRLKTAMSLDGRTAMADGSSRWITGTKARADVHQLRAESGAILTSYRTVMADNPAFTFRPDEHAVLQTMRLDGLTQPLVVVCDAKASLSPTLKLFTSKTPPLVVTTVANDNVTALRQAGAEILQLEPFDGQVPLKAVLQELGRRQINDVLVEAGPDFSGALLSLGLVDEWVIYMAAHLLGSQTRGLVGGLGITQLSDRLPLEIMDIRAIGKDWKMTAKPVV